jgi:hypothetical protein
MKLAHIAQALTIALLVCTAYLAWQTQQEASVMNAKFDRLTKQAESAIKVSEQLSEGLVPGLTMPMQIPSVKVQPAPKATPELTKEMLPPLPKPLAVVPSGEAPLPKTVVTPAPVVGSAGTPAPSVAPAPDAPLPLTPLQRRVKDAPSVGKVKQVVLDQGFVAIDAGTKQGLQKGHKFDLRRESAVVGRVSITDAEEAEAVADLDPKSVPAGVTVQIGDELISVILDK